MAVYSKVSFIEMPEMGTAHGGTSTEPKWAPFTETVTGTLHRKFGNVTSAEIETVWDASTGSSTISPATFNKLWLWTDVDGFVQLMTTSGSGTNVILPVKAKDPFTLGDGTLLAAANETAMTTGAKAVVSIRRVLLGCETASGMNYIFIVID